MNEWLYTSDFVMKAGRPISGDIRPVLTYYKSICLRTQIMKFQILARPAQPFHLNSHQSRQFQLCPCEQKSLKVSEPILYRRPNVIHLDFAPDRIPPTGYNVDALATVHPGGQRPTNCSLQSYIDSNMGTSNGLYSLCGVRVPTKMYITAQQRLT